MANNVKGGPDTASIATAMKNGAKGGHSLTLRFTEAEDIALYDSLVKDAKVDRRPLDQFVLLYLLSNYPQQEVAE